MRLKRVIVTIFILGVLSACSAETVNQKSKLALLVESNTTSIQVITQAMSLALNGRKVNLTANAFTQSPQHTLEKRSFAAADGLMLGIPTLNRFTLFSNGNSCHLVYEKTGKIYPLNGVSCRAL